MNGEVKRDFDINPYSYALNTSRALDPTEIYTRNYADFNIFNELENNYLDINVVDLKFQGEMKWKPVKGLELAALGAVKYQATSQEHTITDYSNQALAYRAMPTTHIRDNNPFLYTDPDNPYAVPITVLPQGGMYERTDYRMLAYDFRASAAYTMNRSVEGVLVGGHSMTNETRELLQGLRSISRSPVTSQRQETTRLHRCI